MICGGRHQLCSAQFAKRHVVYDGPSEKILRNRIERIIALAAAHGVEVLILGAFGCGVFRCPPVLVAEVMREVAKKYQGCFDAIEFAVYYQQSNDSNYRAFCDVFTK